ncbi:MAG: histidine kinase [Acidobacteria bacterium]|nr:histidine kinase [Acidobacteriota bacterium]
MPTLPDGLSARILVVDDQQTNVRLIEYMLRRAGYEAVTSTLDPQRVVALHLQNRYDLIILDLQMPRMNGFEVMTALKAADAGDRVAILVMSADPSQMLPAMEGGAASFLSKPFVLAEVLLRVQAMLETVASLELVAHGVRGAAAHG